MKTLFTYLVFINLAFSSNAQKIFVDASLEQNVDLFQLKEPLDLWLKFLHSENDSIGSKYWNQDELIEFGSNDYFQLNDLDYFELGDKIKTLHYGTTVLSITKVDSLYKIMSQLKLDYNDSVSTTPFIFHVYAKIEDELGGLKLYNPFPINQSLYMKSKKIGNVSYVYPKWHHLDRRLAKKQNKILKGVANEFNIDLGNYTFFFTDNRSSYFKLRGYDFHFENIGAEYPSGKADLDRNEVYSFGNNEYYPHELLHLLINSKWENAHLWFNEGFVTYFGQSRGKDLDWHIAKLKQHIDSHPEFSFSNLLDLRSLDDRTDYRYVIGGLFIKIAYEKGGSALVEKLMSGGKSKNNFYDSLSTVFGVQKENVDSFIKEEINGVFD
ncbi:MAG: hypothetical protein COA33_005740 [Fluviicola sp.]|nr:hypothetical protein [Fluviicola sp.]